MDENMVPFKATLPGDVIRCELDEKGISQKELAAKIGMRESHLSNYITGKLKITKAFAEKIEQALGLSSSLLVNMQAMYDHDVKVIEKRRLRKLVDGYSPSGTEVMAALADSPSRGVSQIDSIQNAVDAERWRIRLRLKNLGVGDDIIDKALCG